MAQTFKDVVGQHQHGKSKNESAHGRSQVHDSPTRQIRISKHTPRHTHKTEEMLHEECHVESKHHEPELCLADSLGEHSPAHLWEPIVKTSHHAKAGSAEERIMEMC